MCVCVCVRALFQLCSIPFYFIIIDCVFLFSFFLSFIVMNNIKSNFVCQFIIETLSVAFKRFFVTLFAIQQNASFNANANIVHAKSIELNCWRRQRWCHRYCYCFHGDKKKTFQSHFIYICINIKLVCINDEIKANSLYCSFGFFDDEYFRLKHRFTLHIHTTYRYTNNRIFMKMEFSSFLYHGFNDILHMLYVIFRLWVLFVENFFFLLCSRPFVSLIEIDVPKKQLLQ